MPSALLDTNAISDLMRDHPRLKIRISTFPESIETSVVAAGEIRYGLERLPKGKKRTDLEDKARRTLTALPINSISEQIADVYGNLKAALEGQGLNLDDNDLWIAATAIANGSILVTRDRIFAKIPGLLVEDWSL